MAIFKRSDEQGRTLTKEMFDLQYEEYSQAFYEMTQSGVVFDEKSLTDFRKSFFNPPLEVKENAWLYLMWVWLFVVKFNLLLVFVSFSVVGIILAANLVHSIRWIWA